MQSIEMLIAYFDISVKEFFEFWNSLTEEERDYYYNSKLV